MTYIDFLSANHKQTKRDYLARVNDREFPKERAAELAKSWGFDYWDGDRRINYGGYSYREGYWDAVAEAFATHYNLKAGDRVLDIGCGKGFLLYDLSKHIPGLIIQGLDISQYAAENCKQEIKDNICVGDATDLPFEDDSFDFVYSINTFHNLHNYDLERAFKEMCRVSKGNKYICVESYETEVQKANLLYWQVTCEAFCTPQEWEWWFQKTGYDGDHSFIYFD